MIGLKDIEERIKDIINFNQVNLFYVFAVALLDQVEAFDEETILQKYNITPEDLVNLKTYVNSIKIGDFSNDTFKDVDLDKITYTDDVSILEVLQNE